MNSEPKPITFRQPHFERIRDPGDNQDVAGDSLRSNSIKTLSDFTMRPQKFERSAAVREE